MGRRCAGGMARCVRAGDALVGQQVGQHAVPEVVCRQGGPRSDRGLGKKICDVGGGQRTVFVGEKAAQHAGFGLARRAVVLRALFFTGVPESEPSLDEGLNDESKERHLVVRLILHYSFLLPTWPK